MKTTKVKLMLSIIAIIILVYAIIISIGYNNLIDNVNNPDISIEYTLDKAYIFYQDKIYETVYYPINNIERIPTEKDDEAIYNLTSSLYELITSDTVKSLDLYVNLMNNTVSGNFSVITDGTKYLLGQSGSFIIPMYSRND